MKPAVSPWGRAEKIAVWRFELRRWEISPRDLNWSSYAGPVRWGKISSMRVPAWDELTTASIRKLGWLNRRPMISAATYPVPPRTMVGMCLDMGFGDGLSEEVGDFDRIVAGIEALNLGFSEDYFAASGVICGGSGNQGRSDFVAVFKEFDRSPCSDRVAGGENNTGERFGDFGIVENSSDAVFTEKAVAHFENDDVGVCFSELVDEGFGERGGVGLLSGDDAEVGEYERLRCTGILHCKDVAAEADSGCFCRGDGESTTDELLNDGEARFGFAGVHAGPENGNDRRKFGVELGIERLAICGNVGGDARSGAKGWKAENAAEDFALVRWPDERGMGGAGAEHSTHIEEVNRVTGFD
jgi:hypothetical protein